jgi:radical SAM superfamily enzyme YgiQ (UPF0313 family)
MNLLLVFPPFPHSSYAEKDQPLGLAALHANVVKTFPDSKVVLLDMNVAPLSMGQVIDKVKKEEWDIVGISYVTPQASFAYAFSKKLKKACPGVVIVHGGPHPTCMPDEAVTFSDFVVIGEGDISFINLIKALKRKEKPPAGVWGYWNGKIIKNDPQEFVKILDDLPVVYRISEEYDHTIHVVPGYAASLMASRGCPNKCTFCCSPRIWKRITRYRSPSSVIDEIKGLINQGINKFHFYDDDFLLNPQFVNTFCQQVKKEDLHIQWVCLASMKSVNRNAALLESMVEAGCVGIEIGIESGDPDVLSQISKPQSTADIEKAVKALLKSGLTVLPLFMTFNPGETLGGHRKQKLFLDTVFCEREGKSLFGFPRRKEVYLGQFATPYPGSLFFEMKSSLGVTLCRQWWTFVSTRINFIPYSLLQDCPAVSTIHVRDYIEMVDALYYKFPSSFGSGMKKVNRARALTTALETFFSLCDGKRTLKEIALSVKNEYNCRRRTALKFAAIAGVIASQCGLFSDDEKKGCERSRKASVIRPFPYYLYYLYVWACLHLHTKERSVKNALTALVGG